LTYTNNDNYIKNKDCGFLYGNTLFHNFANGIASGSSRFLFSSSQVFIIFNHKSTWALVTIEFSEGQETILFSLYICLTRKQVAKGSCVKALKLEIVEFATSQTFFFRQLPKPNFILLHQFTNHEFFVHYLKTRLCPFRLFLAIVKWLIRPFSLFLFYIRSNEKKTEKMLRSKKLNLRWCLEEL